MVGSVRPSLEEQPVIFKRDGTPVEGGSEGLTETLPDLIALSGELEGSIMGTYFAPNFPARKTEDGGTVFGPTKDVYVCVIVQEHMVRTPTNGTKLVCSQ